MSHSFQPYPHGVMFHHFHGGSHPKVQGSISASEFIEILEWLRCHHRILSAREYLSFFERDLLKPNDICLTFDDALLCQAEVIGPILKAEQLEAFFFVYSSPFKGVPEPLEIYRYFRSTKFESLELFYERFFRVAQKIFSKEYELGSNSFDAKSYLNAFPFYSKEDKWFRFLRDRALGPEKYDLLMQNLMEEHHFDPKSVLGNLWMNDKHLKELHSDGHLIGLHSYSHPTLLQSLSLQQQELEYELNYQHLVETLGEKPISMSHPCGSYTEDTLGVLRKLGIRIGFRSNPQIRETRSPLEIPREDHAVLLKRATHENNSVHQ